MTTDSVMRETSHRPDGFDKQQMFDLPSASKSYTSQYNDLYQARARMLKARTMKMANYKWKNETINGDKCKYVNKILDVKDLTPSYIIGTVFVDMKYKPNILKEVSENIYEAPEFPDESKYSRLERARIHSYSDPKTDQVMLEDESGRILLDGELLEHVVLVTGVVVAVLGMVVESGIFTIVDIAYPEVAPQIPRELGDPSAAKAQSILFISGLKFSPSSNRVPLELLKEFIMGELLDCEADNGDRDQRRAIDCLQRTTDLVILGNSVEVLEDPNKERRGKDKYSEINKSNYDVDSLAALDRWISELLVSIPVTILPGETDPAEIELPKQPLHESLFKNSAQQGDFSRLTNPTWLDVNGCRILATSGENVNDLFKYMIPNVHVELGDDGVSTPIRNEILHESRIKLLESNILWQNIAPTCPDTLCCYPYKDTDPFTLTETPHVYVVGNQPKFETNVLTVKPRAHQEGYPVTVIAVPDFSETGQCVWLDTQTLRCDAFRILG